MNGISMNYGGGMSGDIVMWKTDVFITSDRASFLLILFQFLQYCVFVVLSCDAFAPFHRYFYCDSLPIIIIHSQISKRETH